MKAFLSYSFNDNISEITELLTEQGIEVFDSRNDIEYGSSFQQAIKKSITECDFLFLIYSSSNPNIAFEAGIAVSKNKPIFSVISEYNIDPDFLFDSTYVHASPTDTEKIKFNLNIFLDKVKPKKKSYTDIKHELYGVEYINYYTEIYNNYLSISNKSEKEYESLFKDIFHKYELNVIQNKQDYNTQFYTDFCIWSDKLSNVIGNPILIEIKKELNNNNISKIQKTIHKLINNNSAESCLIFYDILNGIKKDDLPNTSKYLFIQISDFIENLNKNDFNESIKKIRNEIMHKSK